MAILPLDNSNFEAETETNSVPVLVDFWAETCPHCLALAPRLEELEHESSGQVKICTVNVDEQPALAARFGIRTIPTMLLFRSGSLAGRMVGARGKQTIRQAIGI